MSKRNIFNFDHQMSLQTWVLKLLVLGLLWDGFMRHDHGYEETKDVIEDRSDTIVNSSTVSSPQP